MQTEIQGTPFYFNTSEIYTTFDEFGTSDAIESPAHTPIAKSLQNTTSPTPGNLIKVLPQPST